MHSGLALIAAIAFSQGGQPGVCAGRKAGASPEAFVVIPAVRQRDTLATAVVCVLLPRASSARVGSYHGEITFDSTTARVSHVAKTSGGLRVENTTIAGRVNFAGADASGFTGGTLLSVALRLRKPGVRPVVHLKMIELNTTDGAKMVNQLVVSTPN